MEGCGINVAPPHPHGGRALRGLALSTGGEGVAVPVLLEL